MLAELRRRNVPRAAAAYLALAWLVVQVTATVLPLFGFPDHSVRVVVMVLAVGFVPAMVAAWSFELTPEGLKREQDVAPNSALEARTNRLLDRLIMLLLAFGIAYFAIDKFVLDPSRDAARLSEAREQARGGARLESHGDRSIAVLPFVNMSSDAEQDYLSDGLAEELLNLLAKIPDLRVISRTSAFSFKGKSATIGTIAKELGVAHILQGSVRKSGDRLRISTQLIDARTDTQLWSQTFDRPSDDVFAIQDEIAAAVIDKLQVTLLNERPKTQRADPQAYLLYVQARQVFVGTERDWSVMERLLEAALEIDPDYADAWVGLAMLYWQHRFQTPADPDPFFANMSAEEADRRSREALERALELDPDNAAGLAWMALRKSYVERDHAAAARLHTRSLELDPSNGDVLRLAAIFATLIRRDELMLRLGEMSVERDPLCTICISRLVDVYMQLGMLEKAEGIMLATADPDVFGSTRAMVHLLMGDPAAALSILEGSHSLSPASVMRIKAMALHDLGRRGEAAEMLEQLKQMTDAQEYALYVAQVYAWFGERDHAVDWAEKQLEQATPAGYIYYFTVASVILRRKLDGFPRWVELQRRYGVAPEQVAHIEFDPVLPRQRIATDGHTATPRLSRRGYRHVADR
jgi:TolB-like protein